MHSLCKILLLSIGIVLCLSLFSSFKVYADGHPFSHPNCPNCGSPGDIASHDATSATGWKCLFRCGRPGCWDYFRAYCPGFPPHVHSYDQQGSLVSGATCYNAAVYNKKCSCGAESGTMSVGSRKSPSWGSWSTTVSPTCTSTGTEVRNCVNCGGGASGHSESNTLSALGHNYGGNWVRSKGTCTSDGTYAHTCSRCSFIENTNTISRRGHLAWNRTDSTTYITYSGSEDGVKEYRCNRGETSEYEACTAILHRQYKLLLDVRGETAPDNFTAWENTYSMKDIHDSSLYLETGTIVRANISGDNYSYYEYATINGSSVKYRSFPVEFTVGSNTVHYYLTYWRKRVIVQYNMGLN